MGRARGAACSPGGPERGRFEPMATIGLVHGSWHGAWCWSQLVPDLEARGHRALAIDLPCEDPASGCIQYAEVVDRALPDDEDLVLVGHSLGGLTIPLVAALRPVKRLVFLCAVLQPEISILHGPFELALERDPKKIG